MTVTRAADYGRDRQTHAYKEYRQALKDGRLVRPNMCQQCGVTGRRIVGHHDTYARPLDVMWLCGSCHHSRHVEIRTGHKGRARCPLCRCVIYRHSEVGGHAVETKDGVAHRECVRRRTKVMSVIAKQLGETEAA